MGAAVECGNHSDLGNRAQGHTFSTSFSCQTLPAITHDSASPSLAVTDLRATAAWYEKLFRRAADSVPMREAAKWKFPRGGRLQVYQLPDRADTCSCTLAISGFEEILAHFQASASTPASTSPAYRSAPS